LIVDMSAGRNVVIVVVIVAVAVGGGYFYMQSRLNSTLDQISVRIEGVEVLGVSLAPPEANLTITYLVNNTSSLTFMVSVDGELYYENTLITPITGRGQPVKADGVSTVDVNVSFTSSILQTLGGIGDRSKYHIEGELKATYLLIGVAPVTVTRGLSQLTSR
jgi:hypothetical protein